MQLIDVRPDIAFTVSKIANKTSSGRIIDMEALVYLVHYLYGTSGLGVTWRREDHAYVTAVLQLIAYGDCGFNTHANGKSQYAMSFYLVNPLDTSGASSFLERLYVSGMFHFKSWMVPTVDLSSCKGETSSVVVEAAKKVIYFRGILEEMHSSQVEPTPVYDDNQSMLTVATKPSGHHRHIKYKICLINALV